MEPYKKAGKHIELKVLLFLHHSAEDGYVEAKTQHGQTVVKEI